MCAAIAAPSLFTSAAWADADSVADSIDDYSDGELDAVSSGNRVTVTGAMLHAKTPLVLDITGVTVVWNATLTGSFKAADPGSALMIVSGGGTFEVSPNGSIHNDASFDIATIELRNGAALVVRGTVGASGDYASAIHAKHGRVTVERGGTVRSPQGVAITAYSHEKDRPDLSSVTLKDTAGITGEVTLLKGNKHVSTFYGSVKVGYDIGIGYDGKDKSKRPLIVVAEGAELILTRSARFEGGPGVDVEIEKGGTLISAGRVILGGTLQNAGEIANSGTFTNKGTITNSGEIVNTGAFVNDGTLINKGTLDTTEGTVANSGRIDNIHGRIDGRKNIGGRGTVIDPHSDGGCDAGLGFAGLAALLGAGVFTTLRRSPE
jgi:hypothetical protein